VILCFDFDLTLTDINTLGYPKKSEDYFTSESLNGINQTFKKISSQNHSIYIVTRGMRQLVTEYISQPKIEFGQYVKKVYGADESFPVTGKDGQSWTSVWSDKKTEILEEIISIHQASRYELYFYDDTPLNIEVAKKNGFKNSYNNSADEHGADLMPIVEKHFYDYG